MGTQQESSRSTQSKKHNMAQTKQEKKTSVPYKAAATDKPASPSTESRNIIATSSARLSADERQYLIQEAAYYRAEQRGFGCGNEMNDWLEAEAEINARFPT